MRVNPFKALKKACEDSSVEFISGYAGTIASSYLLEFPNSVQALNETIALDMAHIQSYLGKRALVLMKNAGLNQAALPFRNMCDIGVHAGVIIIVTDDISAEMSENKQDSRVYAELGKTLLLEPKTVSDVYEMTLEGFKISEEFQMPILMRITNALNDKNLIQNITRKKCKPQRKKKAVKDQSQWVLNPLNTQKIIKVHAERYNKILAYVESSKFNKVNWGKGDQGVIFSQALVPSELKNLKKYDNRYSVGTFPLPIEKTKNFIEKNRTIDIIDSGEGILQNEVAQVTSKKIVDKLIQRDFSWKGLPISLKSRWLNYTTLFNCISNRKPSIVIGDFGSYTLAFESPIEYALHYGGALASGVGAYLSGEKKIYLIVGDGGFSTGIEGLIEAKRKGVKMVVVVIENIGISKKEKINIDLEQLARGNGAFFIKKIKDQELSSEVFQELEEKKGVSILFVDYSNSFQSLSQFALSHIKMKFKKVVKVD